MLDVRVRRRAPAGRRGSSSAPAVRRRHARIPWRAPAAQRFRTAPARRSARTGRLPGRGCRYWPTVSMSTPCARRSRITSSTSSSVSPRPSISPDLVGTPGRRALERRQQPQRVRVVGAGARLRGTGAARSRGCGSSRPAGRPRGCRARLRGGRGSRASALRSACRGERARTARMQAAKCAAPPSRRSSRSTLVITT